MNLFLHKTVDRDWKVIFLNIVVNPVFNICGFFIHEIYFADKCCLIAKLFRICALRRKNNVLKKIQKKNDFIKIQIFFFKNNYCKEATIISGNVHVQGICTSDVNVNFDTLGNFLCLCLLIEIYIILFQILYVIVIQRVYIHVIYKCKKKEISTLVINISVLWETQKNLTDVLNPNYLLLWELQVKSRLFIHVLIFCLTLDYDYSSSKKKN